MWSKIHELLQQEQQKKNNNNSYSVVKLLLPQQTTAADASFISSNNVFWGHKLLRNIKTSNSREYGIATEEHDTFHILWIQEGKDTKYTEKNFCITNKNLLPTMFNVNGMPWMRVLSISFDICSFETDVLSLLLIQMSTWLHLFYTTRVVGRVVIRLRELDCWNEISINSIRYSEPFWPILNPLVSWVCYPDLYSWLYWRFLFHSMRKLAL